jgi:hypothetical protein
MGLATYAIWILEVAAPTGYTLSVEDVYEGFQKHHFGDVKSSTFIVVAIRLFSLSVLVMNIV